MTNDAPASAPAASQKWFYKTDQGKTGPVPTEELRSLLLKAALPRDTPVWRHGMEAWQPAADCDAFADAVPLGGSAMGSGMVQLGGRRYSRQTLRLAAIVGLAAVLAIAMVATRFSNAPPTAFVRGTVTAESRPVTGGTVVLSPVSQGDLNPGKPGVGEVGPDGAFSIRMEGGPAGLATQARVQYLPPPLPPMSEEEAKTAVPPFFGLIPTQQTVPLEAGPNTITIELVAPATK
jgi:hypothetical protein